MNKILTIVMTFVCSIGLVGCQNMSNQDTGMLAGGVAGGLLGSTLGQGDGRLVAIAAGTLAGAMIGGAVGKNMDDNDRMKMDNALESNAVGQPAYWHNQRTAANYQVTPTKNLTVNGNPNCREYRTVATINGKEQVVYGTACRDRRGRWKAIN